MSVAPNSEEFYKKLKEQLYDTTLWPSEYLYKFILKTTPSEIQKIEALFNNMGAVITKVASKNGKYTSISINVRLKNPEMVIERYKAVAENVEGVISL